MFQNSQRQQIKITVNQKDYDMTYIELNNCNKKDMIISHGSFYNADGMLDFAKYFMEDYHVIVPDLPGHYDKPSQAVNDFSLFVEIYKTFIEALVNRGVIQEKPYMAGWSLGGSLTLALACKNILGKAIILDGDSKWTEAVLPAFPNQDIFQKTLQDLIGKPSVGADSKLIEEILLQLPKYLTDYQTANKDMDMDYSLDIREELKNIKIPVIITFGTLDFLTSLRKQQELVAAIDDATFISIEGGTHQVCTDRPDVVAGEILKVL